MLRIGNLSVAIFPKSLRRCVSPSFHFHKHSYPNHNLGGTGSAMVIFPFNNNSSSCRNLSSTKNSNCSNDLESKRNSDAKTSDKLRVILNNLGMSMSQWTIQESDKKMNFDIESNENGSISGRKRMWRSALQGDTNSIDDADRDRDRDANPYYPYNHNSSSSSSSIQPPRRMSEESDIFNNYAGAHSARRNRNQMINTEDIISARLRVRAVHAASNINITKVLTAVFGPASKTPSLSHVFGKTSIIVQLPPVGTQAEKHQHGETISPGKEADKFFHSPESQPRFVAIFRFGSIVFFNISAKDAGDILESVKKHSVDPVPRGFERKEHFEIAVAPRMQDTAHVNADFVTVKELDINNVAVVSTIMGQTVAFDSYNDTVDELLATFESINATVKRTGKIKAMERETLFKVVAQNNSLIIEMIARLGIKDRSDTAWNLSQYERLHEGMKREFEIDPRFEHIEFKLNLIQQNAKFFIDILHNQKSDTLEWIIIILITFECVLSLMDMSGIGPSILQNGRALDIVKALSPPP